MRKEKDDNGISGYIHCKRCSKTNSPPNLECGWTKQGFQVRCFIHNINIVHIDLMGQKVRTI
jgi:hypothetical protein